MRFNNKSSAFTMVEILIVLVILGALIAMFWKPLTNMMGGAEKRQDKLKLAALKNSLLLYKSDVGHFPTAKEGGLKALVQKPSSGSTADKWGGPYVDDDGALEDASGYEIIYNAPPKHKNKYKKYELIIYEGGEEGGAERAFDGA